MTESSWPPRARDSGTTPPTPESIGAVSSEETRVLADPLPEEGPPARSKLLPGLLIGGLVLMTALAAVFGALLLRNSEIERDDVATYLDDQRSQVEERARAAADILINYDASTIEARRTEMLEISTGAFREDYEQVTSALGGALENAAASSSGSIVDEPRVSFLSPEEADAVMRIEQIAQTRENPTGRSINYILRVSLIDTQGGWKVNNIEILSSETT